MFKSFFMQKHQIISGFSFSNVEMSFFFFKYPYSVCGCITSVHDILNQSKVSLVQAAGHPGHWVCWLFCAVVHSSGWLGSIWGINVNSLLNWDSFIAELKTDSMYLIFYYTIKRQEHVVHLLNWQLAERCCIFICLICFSHCAILSHDYTSVTHRKPSSLIWDVFFLSPARNFNLQKSEAMIRKVSALFQHSAVNHW